MSTGVSVAAVPQSLDEDWVELDAPDSEEARHGTGAGGLIEGWVTVDPIDELLIEIKARGARLSESQVHAISDMLAGWQPEAEILGTPEVQEGIRQTIRDIEEWKNSL